jgi:glycine cleavage system H protein
MSEEDVPADLRYTTDHEWARRDSAGEVTVGITRFAVEQLGDITLVSIDVKAGDELAAGKRFGTIESVKTLSDLFAPVSGKVVRINADLSNKPELVNDDCYGKAWMVVIAPASERAIDSLMDAPSYRAHVKASAG